MQAKEKIETTGGGSSGIYTPLRWKIYEKHKC